MADRYLIADELLGAAGLQLVRGLQLGHERRRRAAGTTCSTGRGGDWWGFGPGAHSHVGGVRWWNVKHPAAYAARLAAGELAGAAREVLTGETRRMEESCSGSGWPRACR